MKTSFSLAHLTVLGLAPPEMIAVASRTGYQTVGLRLIQVTETTPGYRLMDDKPMMRATKSATAATGIEVLDIEFVKITPEIKVASLEPFLAAGAELGAKYVITSPYDPDLARLADRLAAISDLASQYRLRALLEFFPWTVIPDLGAALRIVEAAKRPELGILVDTLHFNRSNSSTTFPPAVCPLCTCATPRCRTAIRRRSFCTLGVRNGFPLAKATLISKLSCDTCPRVSLWRWKCR